VDKAGRKILLIVSGNDAIKILVIKLIIGVIMAVSLSAVGFYFHMQSKDAHQGLEIVPLISLNTFMIGYSFGFASVPYVIMGELFPAR